MSYRPNDRSRTIAATIGKTYGDFPVSKYSDAGGKTSFQRALEAAAAASKAVRILNDASPYMLRSTYNAPSNLDLSGESREGVILQMEAGINATVIGNADASLANGFTTDVRISKMTIDQQGALQSGGGGMGVVGIQRWTLEDIVFKKSYNMNFLVSHQATGVANKTGTATFTQNSFVVTGTGTAFTTELAVGDIIKTPSGQFCRVQQINSDTEFYTTILWSYATESAVTFKVITPNSFNYFNRLEFQGTVNSADASGYGFFDNSTVENSSSTGASSAGCGFVPDHTRGMKLINCTAFGNSNSGFSFETCEDMQTIGGRAYGNGNGYQLISGSSRCLAKGLDCFENVSNGFSVSLNNASFPPPDQNTFDAVTGHNNGQYGIRIDGAARTLVNGARIYNNNTGGIITNTATLVPTLTTIANTKIYDDRPTKQQARGVYLFAGDQTKLINVESSDADHTTAGIDLGSSTNTAIITMKNGNVGIGNNNPGNPMNIGTPTTADALARLLVAAGTGTMKGVVIQAGGSTGNLMEFQSTAGNVFANFTSGGLFRGPTGTAGAPTFSFTQDGSTGFYRPSGVANTVRFSTAANDRMQIDTNRTTFMHGMQFKRTAATLNYTIATNDYLIAYTALAAPRTVTLPTAVGVENQQYIIKDESGNAGTNNITVATTSSQTIDGASTKVINSNYGSYTFYSDGANWFVL